MPRRSRDEKEEMQKLERIVRLLNSTRETGIEGQDRNEPPQSDRVPSLDEKRVAKALQPYVASWLGSERHFGNWQKANPKLNRILQHVYASIFPQLISDRAGRAGFGLRVYRPGYKQKLETVEACRK